MLQMRLAPATVVARMHSCGRPINWSAPALKQCVLAVCAARLGRPGYAFAQYRYATPVGIRKTNAVEATR